MEPGVVGWRRPVLLVPQGIEDHLTPRQLDAVLAHELCHVRRRDNLTSTIHMVVETVFWFHPLVWWIGARLIEERERACDEEVLRLYGDPRVYAEGILNVCKRYARAPLICVSGVSGANLRKRVEAIMLNRVGRRLTLAAKVALAAAAMTGVTLPVLEHGSRRKRTGWRRDWLPARRLPSREHHAAAADYGRVRAAGVRDLRRAWLGGERSLRHCCHDPTAVNAARPGRSGCAQPPSAACAPCRALQARRARGTP
jgi:hypothetical protein